MMKVLAMVIGLLVLGIVGLGGLIWMTGSQSIDPETEAGKNYAQTFKSSLKGTCNRLFSSQLGAYSDDADVQDSVNDICKCAADMTYNEFKDESPFALISLAHDPKVQSRIKKRMDECYDRAGIPRMDELGDSDVPSETSLDQ